MPSAGYVDTLCAQDVSDWAEEIRVSDPYAYHWFKVAMCLLAENEVGSHPLLQVPLPPYLRGSGEWALVSGARDIVIDYTWLPESQTAFVWRCALEGPGQRVTAVTFRCTSPPAEPPRSGRAKPSTSSPGRGVMLRLIRAAAWVLPAEDRARYMEEFRSELFDLAVMGVGRFGQLCYSLRLFGHVLQLRAALAVPRRRGAQ